LVFRRTVLLYLVTQPPPWWPSVPPRLRPLLGPLGFDDGPKYHLLTDVWSPARQEIVPLFLELVRDDDPGVRGFAAYGLGVYGPGPRQAQAGDRLAEALLGDPDAGVREEAARGLGRYLWGRGCQEEVAEALAAAVLRDCDEDVRWRAAWDLRAVALEFDPELEGAVTEALRQGQGKEKISFGASAMTDEEMRAMRGWTNLKGLSLQNTEVGDAGLANVSDMRKLVVLNLSGTRVGDAGLVHLSRVARLYHLDLSFTAVSDEGLAHLKGLTRLRELDVRGTAVTEEGVKGLRRSLPELWVIR
jgi:hypothetical protein